MSSSNSNSASEATMSPTTTADATAGAGTVPESAGAKSTGVKPTGSSEYIRRHCELARKAREQKVQARNMDRSKANQRKKMLAEQFARYVISGLASQNPNSGDTTFPGDDKPTPGIDSLLGPEDYHPKSRFAKEIIRDNKIFVRHNFPRPGATDRSGHKLSSADTYFAGFKVDDDDNAVIDPSDGTMFFASTKDNAVPIVLLAYGPREGGAEIFRKHCGDTVIDIVKAFFESHGCFVNVTPFYIDIGLDHEAYKAYRVKADERSAKWKSRNKNSAPRRRAPEHTLASAVLIKDNSRSRSGKSRR